VKVALGLVVLAIALALPGFHLLELYMARMPAMLISHGLALMALVAAVILWRRSRNPA